MRCAADGGAVRRSPAGRDPRRPMLLAALALATAACGGGDGASAVTGPGPAPTRFDIVAAGDIGQCGGDPPSSMAARVAALVRSSDEIVLARLEMEVA